MRHPSSQLRTVPFELIPHMRTIGATDNGRSFEATFAGQPRERSYSNGGAITKG
jgi:hypothetical protein